MRTNYRELITAKGYIEQLLTQGIHPPKNNTTPLDFSRWRLVEIDAFSDVEMVWRDNHDETYRVALPDVVTDYAIHTGRERDPDRLLVHYMQPHLPYIGQAVSESRCPTEIEIAGYNQLETGDADRDHVYELYKDTLRLVLDEVEVLLQNVDADDVVITADHGEAFGEFAAYGHPEGFPHPVVKKVPWVRTSASDEETRVPDIETDSGVSVDVEEHLRDLGYR